MEASKWLCVGLGSITFVQYLYNTIGLIGSYSDSYNSFIGFIIASSII